MKAVTSARLIGREGQMVRFAADLGATLTITVLEPRIFRVTLLRAAGWRLDRTWSVAPGGLEPPFEGRARDDLAGFSCPDFCSRATRRPHQDRQRSARCRGDAGAAWHPLVRTRPRKTVRGGSRDA